MHRILIIEADGGVPFVSKFLALIKVNNFPFLIPVTVASFLVFGLFYILEGVFFYI